MSNLEAVLSLTTPTDALQTLRVWLRSERQRARWTQAELARRSGVPAATLSRLELTGLASTDAVLRVIFALGRLEACEDFLKERLRQANIPLTLNEELPHRPIQRIRHKKESR